MSNTELPLMGKIATALSKAQSEMGSATKDKNNPFFKSKYADLDSIWSVAKGPLTSNGLCVSQVTEIVDKEIVLVTKLIHISGETITGKMPVIMEKRTPQAMGSAITYARRYALAAICGVVTDDDDGEAAMSRTSQPANSNSMSFDDKPSGKADTWQTHFITFGKLKGTKLTGNKLEDLESYCDYIRQSAQADGKKITGKVKEFMDHVDAWRTDKESL